MANFELPEDVKEELKKGDAAETPEDTEQEAAAPEVEISDEQKLLTDCWAMYKDGKPYKEITETLGINKNDVKTAAAAGADILGEDFIPRSRGRGSSPIPAKTDIKMADGKKAGAAAGQAMNRSGWNNIIGALHELAAQATGCDEFRLSENEKNVVGGAFYDAFKDSKIAVLDKYGKYIALFGAIVAVEIPVFAKGLGAYKEKRVKAARRPVEPRPEEVVPESKPFIVEGGKK